jgi:hypothetical protein
MTPSVCSDLDVEVQREESIRFAIRQAEGGDTSFLVLLLSESGSLPDALRAWLAGLFDPKSNLEFAAKIQRRRPGKPPKVGYGVAIAANYVVANLTEDSKLESLIALAIEKYSLPRRKPISRSSIFDYLSSRWPDLAERFRNARRSKQRR